MAIKEKHVNIILFALYNFAYVIYMKGFIGRTIYLLTLLLFLGALAIEFVYSILHGKLVFRFVRPFVWAMAIMLTFLFISVGVQLYHNTFGSYLLEEILYFIVPPVIAFLWINNNKKEDIIPYFYIILGKLVLYFVLEFWGTFSFSNILRISLGDSGSSAYEIVIAHDFLILMIIFMYFAKTKAAVISFVFCLLCFKRFPFILSIAAMGIYIGGRIIRKKRKDRRGEADISAVTGVQDGVLAGVDNKVQMGESKRSVAWLDMSVSGWIPIVVFGLMLLIPFVMMWLYSDSGQSIMLHSFGININELTSNRASIVNYAIENCRVNGLGSITAFFQQNAAIEYAQVGNMHCDVIRLLLEVTIIGYVVYLVGLLKIFKKTRLLFLLLLYIMVEMIVSHMADSLNIWIMMYLFAAYVYRKRAKAEDTEAVGYEGAGDE